MKQEGVLRPPETLIVLSTGIDTILSSWSVDSSAIFVNL